jgi:S1-C subfamily serine protease
MEIPNAFELVSWDMDFVCFSVRLRTHLRRYALMAAFALCTLPARAGQDNNDAAVLKEAKTQARGMALAFQAASMKMLPSVVKVLAKREDVDSTLDMLNLLDEDSPEDFSIGSGVILSADGLCVTNHHVVQNAKGIVVYMSDGRQLIGKDVRSDPTSDIAIFRVNSPVPLPAATMGNSDKLSIGDWVLAIGSPFGLDQTVSVGIISSKRSIDRKRGSRKSMLEGQLLQTDAAINRGNSGGALLDLNGDLIGINSAIYSMSGNFEGVGFAIPSRRVEWIVKELNSQGKVRRSKLGVTAFAIPQQIADELKIPVQSGVYIGAVTLDGPSYKAGMQVGDIVLEIGEQKVFTKDEFKNCIEQLPSDRAYPVKILRDGVPMTLNIQPVAVEE